VLFARQYSERIENSGGRSLSFLTSVPDLRGITGYCYLPIVLVDLLNIHRYSLDLNKDLRALCTWLHSNGDDHLAYRTQVLPKKALLQLTETIKRNIVDVNNSQNIQTKINDMF
jgi:hypothetical protein